MEELCKREHTVSMASSALRNLHTIYKPLIVEHLPPHLVRSECVAIGTLAVRRSFGKDVQGRFQCMVALDHGLNAHS